MRFRPVLHQTEPCEWLALCSTQSKAFNCTAAELCDMMYQMLFIEGAASGGGDAGVTDDLTRDVGTTLYAAPEQLSNEEHSDKVPTQIQLPV